MLYMIIVFCTGVNVCVIIVFKVFFKYLMKTTFLIISQLIVVYTTIDVFIEKLKYIHFLY